LTKYHNQCKNSIAKTQNELTKLISITTETATKDEQLNNALEYIKDLQNQLKNKKEIIKIKSNTEKKGMTIVPLSLYLKGSWIKLTIGVGKGKKLHDKRQDEKQKSIKKEINSALKR
jgi:tmRNA-binding protein